MLIKYFHTNKPAVLLILPLLLVALWFPFYVYQTVPQNQLVSPFVLIFKKGLLLDGIPGMIAAGLTCLASAMLLNRIIINSELSVKPTYLYAFSYVLVESLMRTDAGFYTWQISQLVMILALWPLLSIFNQRQVVDLGFEAGLLSGIAFLVCPPSLPFFLITWFFLQRFRAFNWREWFFPLVGFGLVILFFYVWCIWQQRSIYTLYLLEHFDFKAFYYSQQVSLTLLMALVFIALITYLRAALRSIIQARKQRLIILYLFALMATGITLFNLNGLSHIGYYFTCSQVALFLGHYFGHTRTRWLAELLFLACCTLAITRFSV